MRLHSSSSFVAALLVAAATPTTTHAQACPERSECDRRSLDLTIGGTGISIGDSRGVNGIRLNYRDARLQRVNGINATIWSPYRTSHGVVNGIALGLPVTGADRIEGLGVGVLGVGTEGRFRGIGVGGFGIGSGGDMEGIMVGGLGAGSGGRVRGLAVGGLGVGAGGGVEGIMIGGLGAGAGGTAEGLLVGGLGVGAGAAV